MCRCSLIAAQSLRAGPNANCFEGAAERNVLSRSRQFETENTSAEVSEHQSDGVYTADRLATVPKCLGSEVSWIRSVLTPGHQFQVRFDA